VVIGMKLMPSSRWQCPLTQLTQVQFDEIRCLSLQSRGDQFRVLTPDVSVSVTRDYC